ncbi:MAG: acylneuraminate cytidylyltransferase family protein [Patescibacteria group bacterium]
MKIYAIIPARSGSKGVPNKNIRKVGGKELIGHSIEFAKKLGVDKVICSTDSAEYAEIAKKFGAEVPFLRSEFAASDTAMEEHILEDLYQKFDEHGIEYPDIFVWLRPTFIFRNLASVKECIDRLIKDESLTACRTVVETECRLYRVEDGILRPDFDDRGRSMIRRQEVGKRYKVFSTDVFRGKPKNSGTAFLGNNVGAVIVDKLYGVDIDDEDDLAIAEKILVTISDE